MEKLEMSRNEFLKLLKCMKERELWMYVSLLALSRKNKCNLTQKEIGKVLGIHPTTVHKRIKELNYVDVKGQPLVTTVRQGETNIYYVLDLSISE
jgi:DNA-binding MarR family transcriptional regulator